MDIATICAGDSNIGSPISEPQLRRIIDFCGLPWDDRYLRFWETERVLLTPIYNQIRQSIFRSAMGRWRRYEAHLQSLIEALD